MKQFKIKYFSLIEIIASMAIFTVLMLMMMNFFGRTQDLMTKKASQASQYADAQAALDLIGTQLGNYADLKMSVGTPPLPVANFKVTGTGSQLYFYTREKVKVGTYEYFLKLVGYKLNVNKLEYKELPLKSNDFSSINIDPASQLATSTGTSTEYAQTWEEVISNVIEFKIDSRLINNSGVEGPVVDFIWPNTAYKGIQITKITLTTVNDDDVVKYKGMTGKKSSDPITPLDITKAKQILEVNNFDIKTLTPAQKVLANSIRRFTKTVYLGYRN